MNPYRKASPRDAYDDYDAAERDRDIERLCTQISSTRLAVRWLCTQISPARWPPDPVTPPADPVDLLE